METVNSRKDRLNRAERVLNGELTSGDAANIIEELEAKVATLTRKNKNRRKALRALTKAHDLSVLQLRDQVDKNIVLKQRIKSLEHDKVKELTLWERLFGPDL